MILLFLIEPIDGKESSNEMNERRHGKCKKDSDCLEGEICSIIYYLKSWPPQPVYGCVPPNGNPKSPKQGIKMKFRSSSYSTFNIWTETRNLTNLFWNDHFLEQVQCMKDEERFCDTTQQDPQRLCCDGLRCTTFEPLMLPSRCVKDNSGNNYQVSNT